MMIFIVMLGIDNHQIRAAVCFNATSVRAQTPKFQQTKHIANTETLRFRYLKLSTLTMIKNFKITEFGHREHVCLDATSIIY